jgi:hypothetical protein
MAALTVLLPGSPAPPLIWRHETCGGASEWELAVSEQRLVSGGRIARAPAGPPGGSAGLERGLDGGGDELRGLRVDGDVPAQQHAADDLPDMPGRVLRGRRPCQPSFLR